MSSDFIDDILQALKRIGHLDCSLLKEIMILCGMPEETANLRYLSYNRQEIVEEDRRLEFSAVAVINNRRAGRWMLKGFEKKISQVVFSTKWTRNPLDLFLNNLRCDPQMVELLSRAAADYTLLGILQIEEFRSKGLLKHRIRRVRPVVAVPGLDNGALPAVECFETANEILHTRIKGLSLYRKVGRQMSCV